MVEPISSGAASVPSVTVPPVSVGGVSTPAVSTPLLPSVALPIASSSHAPARPTPSAARVAATGSSSSSSASAASWFAKTASFMVSATSADTGLSGSAEWFGTAVATGAATSAGRAAAAARRAHASSGPFTERYLRRTVLRFRGCLGAIARQDARDLILRTGVGIKRSYGRIAVARMLRVSLRSEGQIERRAVAALQTAASDGFCPAAGASRTAARLLTETVEASPLAGLVSGPLVTGVPGSSAGHRSHRLHRKATRAERSSVSSASAGLPLPHPGSSSGDLLLILLAALGATALLAVVARQRTLRTHHAPVPVARQETLAAFRGTPVADELVAAAGLRGAVTALRRADERGDPAGAAGVGVVLEQQGDVQGALDAYRRADERGNIHGTLNLGALLARQGDVAGAIDAYRRADERGSAIGSLHLGRLLGEQGDEAGAIAAFRRARERGDEAISQAARDAWMKLIGN